MKRFQRIVIPAALTLAMLTGCVTVSGQSGTSTAAADSTAVVENTAIDTDGLFSQRDLEQSWDESAAVRIELTGDTASSDSDAVQIDGGTVTIGQISTLADIRLRRRGEPEQVLSGTEEKSVLMGREIAAFAAAVEQGRTDQNELDALALSVSRVMRTIRRQAGIRFPGGEEGERHG